MVEPDTGGRKILPAGVISGKVRWRAAESNGRLLTNQLNSIRASRASGRQNYGHLTSAWNQSGHRKSAKSRDTRARGRAPDCSSGKYPKVVSFKSEPRNLLGFLRSGPPAVRTQHTDDSGEHAMRDRLLSPLAKVLVQSNKAVQDEY